MGTEMRDRSQLIQALLSSRNHLLSGCTHTEARHIREIGYSPHPDHDLAVRLKKKSSKDLALFIKTQSHSIQSLALTAIEAVLPLKTGDIRLAAFGRTV